MRSRLLDRSHSDRCEVVPHCGLDLHFSDNEWCWASFHVFVSHPCLLSWCRVYVLLTSLKAQLVKNPPAMQKTPVWFLDQKDLLEKGKATHSISRVFLKFPCGTAGKESACNAGDLGLIPGLGRSSGEGNGNPLQYSCLENSLGQRSLAGHSPWGCKESDMTEQLSTPFYMMDLSICRI